MIREGTPHAPLRIRSRFKPFMVFYNSPIRLTFSLLVCFFLLPEFLRLARFLWGMEGMTAQATVVAGIVLVIFLPQILVEALNCRKVSHDFHDDYVEFTENFMLREPIRLSYRSITAVSKKTSRFQRFFGLSDIVLTTEVAFGRLKPRQAVHVIPDVQDADLALQAVNKILVAFRARQGVVVKGASGSLPHP